jgi:hypothetical protein
MEWVKAQALINLIKHLEEDIRPHSTVAACLLRMVALEIYEIADGNAFAE